MRRGSSKASGGRGFLLLSIPFMATGGLCLALLGLRRSETAHNPLQEALQAYYQGDSAQARILFEKILESDPENAVAHNHLGKIDLKDGRPHQAIAHFVAVLKQDRADYETHLELARAYSAAGLHDAALAVYLEAARLRPQDPGPIKSAGRMALAAGDSATAAACLAQAWHLDPNDPETLELLAAATPSPEKTQATQHLAERGRVVQDGSLPRVAHPLEKIDESRRNAGTQRP